MIVWASSYLSLVISTVLESCWNGSLRRLIGPTPRSQTQSTSLLPSHRNLSWAKCNTYIMRQLTVLYRYVYVLCTIDDDGRRPSVRQTFGSARPRKTSTSQLMRRSNEGRTLCFSHHGTGSTSTGTGTQYHWRLLVLVHSFVHRSLDWSNILLLRVLYGV